ncbi:MAG TPA: LssY C-terminal domain-containing protein [Ktedonobacteraceae bacterium]|nr:LssY C-terminal domain-containing protein [Ktedonobacteraceae bacterium]
MESAGKTGRSAGAGRNALIFAGSGVLALSVAALVYLLSVHAKLHHASKHGRAVSAAITPADNPLTSFNREGKPGDPLNLEFVGTDGQIGASFASAGWYRADEIRLVTSARICTDCVLGREYCTAPVSNLYLFGRKEDLAFERPGGNARQRDHIRIWNTGRQASDGRPIWIGSATKDVKVELSKTNYLPTHQISPDVDAERMLVVTELVQTGNVIQQTTRPGFGKETHGFNGGGDPYFTDGQIVVLTLANIPTTPFATQVRSPFLASIAKRMAPLIRARLTQSMGEQMQQTT